MMELAYQKPLRGQRMGVVFGSFAPLHQGHMELILRAKRENDAGCMVIVCGYDGDKGEPIMPHRDRYRYVREFFKNDDLVAVYAINDTESGIPNYPNGWDGWMKAFAEICAKTQGLRLPLMRWYVGEEEYYSDLIERGEDAVLVKRENPISGTLIRKEPLKHWEKIALPFRHLFSHNVLIIGTASEGKTQLVQDLAKYYGAPCSEEWARGYMEKHSLCDWELTGQDFITFLMGQYEHNMERMRSPENRGVLFADSDGLTTMMYAAEYAENDKSVMTQEELAEVLKVGMRIEKECKWNKIFLLAPFHDFVDDHSRWMEHADKQERYKLLERMVEYLVQTGLWNRVTVVAGDYWSAFDEVRKYVDEVMGC